MSERVPVLFGEVLFDCFDDGSRVMGGAPFNVAWHLQAFGCDPFFISRVGDDPLGREICETMKGWGMTTAGLQIDAAHPTGEVKVHLVEGQPGFDIVSDRAFDYIQGDTIPPISPSLIYHGSLGLRMPDSAFALEKLMRDHPAPVFLDVNLRPPWWKRDRLEAVLDKACWVKINDVELATLMDESGDIQGQAARLLQGYGLDWVIVTQGEKGAFIMDRNGGFAETSPDETVPVVDTVGAGDAFASVCILGLLHDWPLALVVERAQQFASLIVGLRGAVSNDISFYKPVIAQWRLESNS